MKSASQLHQLEMVELCAAIWGLTHRHTLRLAFEQFSVPPNTLTDLGRVLERGRDSKFCLGGFDSRTACHD